MARFPWSNASAALSRTRVLAFVALALAMGLVSLRVGDLTAPAPAQPLSQQADAGQTASAAVEHLLGTLAGPGAVRVMIHPDGEGARSVLVLLDTRVQATERLDRAALVDLMSAAGVLDPEAGDRLNVLRAPFATPLPQPPAGTALLELAATGLLASFALAWCVAAVFAVPEPAHRPALQEAVTRATGLPGAYASNDNGHAAAGSRLRPDLVQRGRDTLRADPARAADVLRSWITTTRRAV